MILARMCPCADSYETSLLERNIRLPKIVIFLFFSVRFYFSAHFYPVRRFKAVMVLARMCPCADSYEPLLLERNIRLSKIVLFLFFSVRFYFSAHFYPVRRFEAVMVLARMCPCADSYETSLLERNIRLPKIVIFLFFSVRFYFSAHFYPVLKQ